MEKVCKKILAFCVLLCSFQAFAKKDITERKVDEMASWQETFDINKKKPGKYNIVVTAEDKGGNTELAGPFNLFIDPDSDYPIATITNPANNMRVPGHLNIVGTCIDDDGVAEVWIKLDGGEPEKANGKEFWSYYLNTLDLEEGPHTIEVYGVDVNGLSSVDKPNKKAFVTWNLDRRQPVTQVTNYALGDLVSGKIDLKGTVSDGNGIKELFYSLDNGENFIETKIKENKNTGEWTFEIPIDTRKIEDGPAVIWFRAKDKMGSVGLYSYLYFIDNTKPDVKIISPEPSELSAGIFGIAGWAKDKVGLAKLGWSFNGKSGEFDLVPGNPYWFVEVDTRQNTAKALDFIITAEDTAGNIVIEKRAMNLNQELDKPVVNIISPKAGELLSNDTGSLFLRGIVTDNNGVASVEYSLDNNPAEILEADGVFYAKLGEIKDLTAGAHKVTVTATDIYGTRGNPVVASFTAMGALPVFEDTVVKSSEGSAYAGYGLCVNPETNPNLEMKISSESNLASVSYTYRWGKSEPVENVNALKSPVKSVDISLPLYGEFIPWGVLSVSVSAKDIYDRVSRKEFVFNVQDLSEISVTKDENGAERPEVIFNDSRVGENGDIINDPAHPVTGYFKGGKIKNVSLVPDTSFAAVESEGNFIKLSAGRGSGASSPVRVRVVTDKNTVYESRELIFHSAVSAPMVFVSGDGDIFDGNENLHLEGSVISEIPLHSLQARIFRIDALGGSVITSVNAHKESEIYMETIPLTKGSFSIDIPSDEFRTGMTVVEIIADNGQIASGAVFVRKIPELPAVNPQTNKPSVRMKPAINWIEGHDVYSVITYQGEIENDYCEKFSRAKMTPGVNVLEQFAYGENETVLASSKYNASNGGVVKVNLSKIGDMKFSNGMKVFVPYGNSKEPVKAYATVESDFPVTSVSYKISGAKVPGGDEVQSGRVAFKNISENLYECEIPLNNLPVRQTKVEVTAETSQGKSTYYGIIEVVRDRNIDFIDNEEKIYWYPQENVQYDPVENRYLLEKSMPFAGYANVMGPVRAELVKPANGLHVYVDDSNGKFFYIYSDNDGIYRNVSVRVYDSQGNSYVSTPVDLLFDSENPNVEIKSPEAMSWTKDSVELLIGTNDSNGISRVEYSIDNSETWQIIDAQRKTANGDYKTIINLSEVSDGIVPIDVRVKDGAEKYTYAHTVVHKDTTPPAVDVVVPGENDIVNGENLIAFIAKDDGKLVKAEYIPPKTSEENPVPIPLEIRPMIQTHIGIEEKPISDLMKFRFVDAIGNETVIDTWNFFIDQQSDLPVAEIHLPEENAVLTRDFEISGVIFDDDGIIKDENGEIIGGPQLWYKFDNGEYKLLTKPGSDEANMNISSAIQNKLNDFTDNEHSITVYSIDINGVRGPEYTRNFRISLEEPKGKVFTPTIDETVKGTVKLTGVATDKNGIKAVYVSVDNGNSYNEAIGKFGHEITEANWSYEFDTRVIEDGTHVVFLKIVDWYGIEGLFSTLINIDNTNPNINLELPLDDSKTTGTVFFSGQTTDNIGLTKLYITIRSLEGKSIPSEMNQIELEPDEIITKALDISSLQDGFYNVELTGMDAADNITRVSCNIQLDKNAPKAKVDLLYPLNGEFVQGVFNVYGTAKSEVEIDNVEFYIDGKKVTESGFTPSEYYKFTVKPDMISEGQHKIQAKALLIDGTEILSNEQYLNYSSVGPWITIDNFTYGDFAIDRPYIIGNAGYSILQEEVIRANAKGASKEFKDSVAAKAVEKVEVSLNNGKTFQQVSTSGKWRYRIENEDIAEGYHFLLVRAVMKNGEVAVTRCIVQVDKTKPSIKLISPGEGGRYNQEMVFRGLAHDDIALKSLTLALRQGDKASYEVPAFIQGLYLDWHFWGATLFDIGAGLTFFDDNVKLQVQWGQFTQAQRSLFNKSDMRYGGDNVFGMKLLANVYYLPFRYLLGPDWDWLSMNVAVGANFTRFSESGSGKAQILSAGLMQVEFPRIRFAKQKMFRTIAFYTEGQLWFIPTDVSNSSVSIASLVPQISVGLRVNVF